MRAWLTRFALPLAAGVALVGCAGNSSTNTSTSIPVPTAASPAPSHHRHHRHHAHHHKPQPVPQPTTTTAAPPPTPPVEGPGSTSHATDTEFCDTHACIPSFFDGNGAIVQCQDGQWSHSGGLSGACSDHGGER